MKPSAALFLVLLAACSGAPQPAEVTADVPRSESEVTISTGEPVTLADLSIDGMTCAMGCGGTIRSALAKLPGVSATEVNFTDADQTNHVVVTYDPAQVTDADMVKAVQAIHDGQYKVMAVSVTKQVLKEGAQEEPAKEEASTGQVNAEAVQDVVLPSVVALLSRLVRI